MEDALNWDDSYAIALELMKLHTSINLETVSLAQILEWTLSLPDFEDDPQMSNDSILLAIYQEWYEEVNSI